MTELAEHYQSTTEAGTIADLATQAARVDVHTVDVHDDRGRPIERRIYGRDQSGGLALVDTIDVINERSDAANRPPDVMARIVAAHDPDTLVAYVDRHLNPDSTTLWGDVDAAKITVVLNDYNRRITADGIGFADWADHRAELRLQASPEWLAWTGLHDKPQSQEEMAEFLEEHLLDIHEPDGSTMLEVARTFQATVGATFERAISTHSSTVQLSWHENVEAKVGESGQFEPPRELVLALRPFIGSDPVLVKGQFRYRVSQGKLTLGWHLLRLDEIRRDAVEAILTDVAERLELIPFRGAAPAAGR